MTKEELKKEAEKKYCNGCKWRIEQCLWAWRNTNGLNEPNEKNCSCKEVPAYLAGAEPREKRIAELEAQIEKMKKYGKLLQDICGVMGNDPYMVWRGLEQRVLILWDKSEEQVVAITSISLQIQSNS